MQKQNKVGISYHHRGSGRGGSNRGRDWWRTPRVVAWEAGPWGNPRRPAAAAAAAAEGAPRTSSPLPREWILRKLKETLTLGAQWEERRGDEASRDQGVKPSVSEREKRDRNEKARGVRVCCEKETCLWTSMVSRSEPNRTGLDRTTRFGGFGPVHFNFVAKKKKQKSNFFKKKLN